MNIYFLIKKKGYRNASNLCINKRPVLEKKKEYNNILMLVMQLNVYRYPVSKVCANNNLTPTSQC